jgi:hypothetical protein
MLDKLFKLEKLTITPLDPSTTSPIRDEKFKCLFNPSKYSLDYEIGYQCVKLPNKSEKQFSERINPKLSLELILDGTGVDQIGLAKIFNDKTVKKQLDQFLKIAFELNDKTHEPNAVKIEWGKSLSFQGRLESAKVDYELFDKSGEPLRARLNVTFVEHRIRSEALKKWKLNSPDLTHIKLVNSEENLPLKTYEIYQDSRYYLEVARVNKLNNFRRLQVGQKLVFPPIEQ